jgi:hypothetical protein
MKMSMEHAKILTGEIEGLGENRVLVPLYPPQSHMDGSGMEIGLSRQEAGVKPSEP